MSTFPLHGRWEITQQEYRSMPCGVVGEGEKYRNITAAVNHSSGQVRWGGSQSVSFSLLFQINIS